MFELNVKTVNYCISCHDMLADHQCFIIHTRHPDVYSTPFFKHSIVGRTKPDKDIPTWKDLEDAHPDMDVGGHWKPRSCLPRQRACLFLPYRDREPHLLLWLKFMLPFMKKQNMDFRIFVTEQVGVLDSKTHFQKKNQMWWIFIKDTSEM